jgi:UDP-4-amino-4,6-dideoxy-N-acetyl-beta-L-altrosamine transaminase
MIPYGRQDIHPDDIDAVTAVLTSDFLTQGPVVPQFEQAIADYCRFAFGVAFNSATSALHAACLALGVGKQSRVWVSSISFVASANCAEYCGAKVSFVDVEPDTGNMCMDDLEQRLVQAQKNNTLPHVVICAHYAGHYCALQRLKKLSTHYGFRVIEDASHALGAALPSSWQPNERGDVVVFSFHPVKMITSAEGGMAVTHDKHIAHQLRLFGNHGIERQSENFCSPSPGDWYYEQQQLGWNYRMSDVHAALGLSQLNRLDEFLKARRDWAHWYQQQLTPHAEYVQVVNQTKHGMSSYHLFPVLISAQEPSNVFKQLRGQGIGVQKHYIPIPAQPYYANKYGYDLKSFPHAMRFYQSVISLPLFPQLTSEQTHYVVKHLLNICRG